MALVEVGRFLDLTEAQAAAAALRASGMETMLQGEHHGQAVYRLQQALGGFGLWVDEADAADARAFLENARAEPIERLERPHRGRSFAAVLLGLIFGG